jgi:hypothetical protein
MSNNDCKNKFPLPPDATDFSSNLTEFTAKTQAANKTERYLSLNENVSKENCTKTMAGIK